MKRTLTELNIKEKTVLLRADFNVPIDQEGNILDDTRIRMELPTIKYILKQGAKLIICSHLGKPKGTFNKRFSMFPISQYLMNFLNCKITFATDAIGPDATKKAKELKPREILILENLRFYKEEEEDNLNFAKKLASFADVYVNDAFGTIHRKHASIHRVAKLLPNNAMGFLMGKEITTITETIENPKRPFIVILGGAKVSDKIGVIDSLIEKLDKIIIVGGMENTYFQSQGYDVGKSIVDEDKIEYAKSVLDKANKENIKIILPEDFAVGEQIGPCSNLKYVQIEKFPKDLMGLDIGPKTISKFKKIIKLGKTFIWNGPMGAFEIPEFSVGTESIAKAIAKAKGVSIVGGGDSVAAIKLFNLEKKITHISTGGGATLALLEGAYLPGYDALTEVREIKWKKFI